MTHIYSRGHLQLIKHQVISSCPILAQFLKYCDFLWSLLYILSPKTSHTRYHLRPFCFLIRGHLMLREFYKIFYTFSKSNKCFQLIKTAFLKKTSQELWIIPPFRNNPPHSATHWGEPIKDNQCTRHCAASIKDNLIFPLQWLFQAKESLYGERRVHQLWWSVEPIYN